MTISTTIIKNSYSGNGSTTVFAYSFKIATTADIEVIIRSSTGTETVKTLTTHYSVSGAGSSSGGNVTMVAAPATGETLVIRRATTQTQSVDLVENDPFTAESVEGAFDKNLSIVQELQEELDRSIKISKSNTITSSEMTENAAARANKVLSFDATGEIALDQELGIYKGNWAASTVYAIRSIVKDTSNNNIYLANTAHTSSGSQPISSNTDVAKWDLIVDAAAATTSATAAATSATAAATSATAAATSATASATSATSSASQVSLATAQVALATTQAGNSATSATAAATAQAAAEAALDTFDDVYLGAKSSAPTVDNDGDALTQGDLYYNTAANTLNYYTGSVWTGITSGGITSVAADPTPQLGGDLDLNGRIIDFKPEEPVSNANTIGADTTTTLTTTRNYILYGPITVSSSYTWTVGGSGVLSIL